MLLNGGETLELAGITFEVLSVPGHSPAHLAYAAEDASSRATSCSRAAVGRTDLPGGDWDTLLDSIRLLGERFPPETLVYSGHGPPTTLGAELAAQPVPRRAPRRPPVKFQAPRGTHDILPSRAAALAARDRARSSACARSTATADPDAGLRGHRAVRADVGRGLGHRPKEMYSSRTAAAAR